MTKKLKIIGPYTPEHPGPFCTREGRPVRVLCRDAKSEYSIGALILGGNNREALYAFRDNGRISMLGVEHPDDLMNAEEVPVAREFWLAGNNIYTSKEDAEDYCGGLYKLTMSRLDIIHVREVLPGGGE